MSDHLIPLSCQMLTSAVRYALGRQTCIVAWTVNETIRVWDEVATITGRSPRAVQCARQSLRNDPKFRARMAG